MKKINKLENKQILISGGTGSLGKELVKSLSENNKIVVYSRNEERQYNFKTYLKVNNYNVDNIIFKIGDVRDTETLKYAMNGCEIAIHAAAMKDVIMCEEQPTQTVLNNIEGSKSFIRAVEQSFDVKKAIGISTDKAADPSNVYGMTKYIMEQLFVEASKNIKNVDFSCTRFGNMIDSTGSLITVWKENPTMDIKITHPEASRFFFKVSDAVQTVIDAITLGKDGDIYIPDMKKAKILNIIKLITKRENIEEIGLFPGEKIHEDLIGAVETKYCYKEGEYYIIRSGKVNNNSKIEPFSSLTAIEFTNDELERLIYG